MRPCAVSAAIQPGGQQPLQSIAHHNHAGAGELRTYDGGLQFNQDAHRLALVVQGGVFDDSHGQRAPVGPG